MLINVLPSPPLIVLVELLVLDGKAPLLVTLIPFGCANVLPANDLAAPFAVEVCHDVLARRELPFFRVASVHVDHRVDEVRGAVPS